MLLESSCFKLSHAMCMCAGILCTCYQISNAGYFLIIGAVNIFNTINHCILNSNVVNVVITGILSSINI